MAFKWYVIQAYSGYEKRVKLQLEEQIKLAGMEDSFGAYFSAYRRSC